MSVACSSLRLVATLLFKLIVGDFACDPYVCVFALLREGACFFMYHYDDMNICRHLHVVYCLSTVRKLKWFI